MSPEELARRLGLPAPSFHGPGAAALPPVRPAAPQGPEARALLRPEAARALAALVRALRQRHP